MKFIKMNTKALFLFLVLLSALALCTFFGNCSMEGYKNRYMDSDVKSDDNVVQNRGSINPSSSDNYNHYNNNAAISSTQVYGSTGSPFQTSDHSLAYQSDNSGSVSMPAINPSSNPAVKSENLESGHNDLNGNKPQTGACPVCPSVVIPRQEPCPACPACARCPEPSFECKKVPNYNAISNDSLPVPVLTSFSQFGM